MIGTFGAFVEADLKWSKLVESFVEVRHDDPKTASSQGKGGSNRTAGPGATSASLGGIAGSNDSDPQSLQILRTAISDPTVTPPGVMLFLKMMQEYESDVPLAGQRAKLAYKAAHMQFSELTMQDVVKTLKARVAAVDDEVNECEQEMEARRGKEVAAKTTTITDLEAEIEQVQGKIESLQKQKEG